MSHDLAVWADDRPLDNDQVGPTCNQLCERCPASGGVVVPAVPRRAAYVEALVARYPDNIDHSVV
ncbi:hypothetical protein [Streptomyces sp. NPDC001743]|uniref:hypothetical protein n=1 Tax=Streptomyces sp. NPDC001743 TaxID=3154397 RepID=UPI0033274D8B